MRIGVDARALAIRPAGIEVYTRKLLAGFADLAPENRYFLYSTKDFPLPGKGPFVKRIGRGLWSRKGSVWMQVEVPKLCARDGIDLFWSPLQTLPVGLSRRVPAVLTVHDFVQINEPGSMARLNWLIMKVIAPPSWRRADAFVTGSKHSASRLQRIVGPGREITVIPHGSTDLPRPPSVRASRDRLREAFGIDGPFVLAVGTLEPRKNLGALVRAMTPLLREGESPRVLVIAGGRGWKDTEIFRVVEASGVASRVVFTGPVSDSDLGCLYAACDLFVFPSLYEGFGLPVLEAMSLGAPVACSRSSSIPEVAGDAAVLFDPRNPRDMEEAIRRALADEGLRDRLRDRGLRRAAGFDWLKSARATLDAFERARARTPSGGAGRRTDLALEAEHFNRISRAFAKSAPPEHWEVFEPTSWETSLVRDAFAHLGPLGGSTFLDHGCGWGHNAVFAARNGASASVGFDISLDSLHVARTKAQRNGVGDRAFFVAGLAERLPFRDGVFDRVAGNGILHHVDLSRASRELRRVLDPETGRASFTEPSGGNPLAQVVRRTARYTAKYRLPWERPLTAEDVRRFLEPFPRSRSRSYYLLTALQRAWRGHFPMGAADALDRRILDALPFLGRFAAQVLLLI